MASKSVLMGGVIAATVLSVGTGTYLAFRANQTAAPPSKVANVAETTSSSSQAAPAVESPAPSPNSRADRTVVQAPAPAQHESRPRSEPRPAPVDPRTSATARPEPAAATPAATTPSAATPAVDPVPVSTAGVTAVEPPPVQDPPKPRFEELTVKEDSVIGIRIDQAISSESAKVEDRVTAKITRDVTVDGRTALPAGTRLEGVVTIVERGGKLRERARLGIRFNMLVLSDGLRVPIQTDTIFREGESPTGEASSKIGASAVAGAILGGLIGGKRGAIIGTTAGAAGGTAAVMAGGRNEATFAGGAPLAVRLIAPVTITIERTPVGL